MQVMLKYSLLGNCQITPLSKTLNGIPEFNKVFEYIDFPPVHTIDKNNDRLFDIFKDIDLLIYQPVIDKSRFGKYCSQSVLAALKTDAKAICIPSMYYGGYFPTLGMISEVNGPLNLVHDFYVIATFLNGQSTSETINAIKYKFPLNKMELIKQNNASLGALRLREKEYKVDIKISDYIEDKFRKERLFYTFNHPTHRLFGYVCSRILEKLNIDYQYIPEKDMLNNIVAPVYEPIIEALGLNFSNYYITNNGEKLDIEDLVNLSYSEYESVDKSFLLEKLKSNKKFIYDLVNNKKGDL